MKVAVVGGGFAAFIMAKSLKEEAIDFVCFEKTSKIGGTWCHREKIEYGVASTTSRTMTINSKELIAFSDYPSPDDFPNFPKHYVFLELLLSYAQKHDIIRHFKCNREVVQVKRAETYETTGQWVVTVKDTINGDVNSEVYDGVMLCTGQFAHPTMPDYPGSSNFQGRIMHSHSLKTFESFAGKNVVVVGFGTSALDAAVEISNVAKQVYLSSRSQAWVLPRLNVYGVPTDFVFFRRFILMILRFSSDFLGWLAQKCISDIKFKHCLYGIHPSCNLFSRDPVFCDDLATKLASRAVVLRKTIQRYGQNSVIFEEEIEETPVDDVVMATGYKHDFSYLEDGIFQEEKSGKFSLYKCMYPVHLKHASLAFIGFILPWGSGILPAELQTRWATFLLNGKGSLPSREYMMKEIDNRYKNNLLRFTASSKMSQRVDAMDYSDDLASEIGVKPNFWRMLIKDPSLFVACIFGPYLSYQYRLDGPHKWSGARDAILTAGRRMKTGLSPEKPLEHNFMFKDILLFIIIASIFMLFLTLSNV